MKVIKRNIATLEGFSIVEAMVGLSLITLVALLFFQMTDQVTSSNSDFLLKERDLKTKIVAQYRQNPNLKPMDFNDNNLSVKAKIENHPKFVRFKILSLQSQLPGQVEKRVSKYLIHE